MNIVINLYKKAQAGLARLRKEAPLLYSAIKTGMAAFAAVFMPVAVTFMNDLYLWLDDGGEFPLVDNVLRALVAGALAGVAGVVNFMWNLRDNATPPVYIPEEELNDAHRN